MDKQHMVYLDWAATAPLSPEAYEAMLPFLQPDLPGLYAGNGNANSLHSAGRDAFKVLESARRDIARAIEARPDEFIFTSGATEADNIALVGIVEGILQKHGLNYASIQKEGAQRPTIVVSAIEHDAVLQAAELLKRRGVEVVTLRPNASGHITPQILESALEYAENVVLVSVMALNNETGVVMDVPALAQVAHSHDALFHCDATQALGKVALSVKTWGVDALSLSSHKVGGPKGVGALYLKARTPFCAQTVGGGQEANRRSGTQNIAGVVGFAASLTNVVNHQELFAHQMVVLRDKLYQGLIELPGVEPVVNLLDGLHAPNIVSVTCAGFESETLILQLDKRGICVSGGSACASRSLDPSHVLSAMGIPRDRALGMLRFSLGPTTTAEDIDYCLKQVREVLEK
jgi:cysteine desulfurase